MANNDGDDGPSGLQFVNMIPMTQAERQRNRKVIRSAAMKTFRRTQKLERVRKNEEKPLTSRKALEEQELYHRPRYASKSEHPSLENRWEGTLGPISQLAEDTGVSSATTDVNQASWSQTALRTPSIVSYPIDRLGAGRIDPFRSYPVDITGPYVNEIMDHSVTVIWPGFRPGTKDVKTKLASAWFELAAARPIVTHAMLFGGAVHRDVLRNPRLSADNPIRLYHKVQTMRLLKEALKDPDEMAVDDIILAVMALSTNEVETLAVHMHRVPSPFSSPLTSVQWLDVYGRISFIHAHTVALRSLVARRGGLEKVELDGLAEVLSLADILGATQAIQRPHFPFLDRWIHEPDDLCASLASHLSRVSLATGFQDIVDDGITDTVAQILEAMADLTIEIDLHHRGVKPICDMALFMDRRNAVQQRLMSLPSGDELEPGGISSPHMYESVRLAGIIYSAGITFPIPPYQGIFRRLSRRLKVVLGESKFDECWQFYPKTLLWVLLMGGIAALESEERRWYVLTFAVVSRSLEISGWDDVVEEMAHYLWLETACDAGGRLFWAAVADEL